MILLNSRFESDVNRELEHKDKKGKIKVVYRLSGKVLQAARVSCDVMTQSKVYWMIAKSEEEAQFLVGIFNCPMMQPIYHETKTDRINFHKSPLKHIPIPEYNSKNNIHGQIVSEIEKLEDKGGTPNFNGLNPLLEKLLPEYTKITNEDYIYWVS